MCTPISVFLYVIHNESWQMDLNKRKPIIIHNKNWQVYYCKGRPIYHS
jgi:hypothetical protein